MPGLLPQKTCRWTSDIAPPARRWIRCVLGQDVIVLSDVMLGRRFRFRFLIDSFTFPPPHLNRRQLEHLLILEVLMEHENFIFF
jgi:hypothetical protein